MLGTLLTISLLLLADEPAKPVKFGVLSSPAPKEWVSQKPANLLRKYQFQLKASEENLAPAEIAVFHEASPKVKEKFEEWKATFVVPEGKTVEEIAKTSTFELPKKTTAHVLDITGTWKYRERPRDPKSKEELRPEYRVVWVILVQEDETTHIRLSGPEKTVAIHHAEFVKWLQAAK